MTPAVSTLLRVLALAFSLAAGAALASALIDDDPVPAKASAGMGLPNTASWGASDQKTPRPSGPNRGDIRWFQDLVDAAPAGSTLKPPAGTYAGPVVVDKPLIIDGSNGVVIDGGGRGTVMVVEGGDSQLRDIRLTNSGASHDTDDACLNLRKHHNTIERVTIDNCLFGIDLKQSDDNVLIGNKISSKAHDLGTRGDGLRLWYSNRNRIEDNEIIDSRDMVAWYSNDNVYRNNLGRRSRYSIHFMFAARNLVEGNRFYDNAVGIYVMYSGGGAIRNNVISHATGATGMAIGFKEASDVTVEGNEIIYCGTGITSDLSPFEPDSKLIIRNNRIAFNVIGMRLVSDREGHVVEGNTFEGNMSNVAVDGSSGAMSNRWSGNYWDDYQGFDRDGNGIGDRPHELYAYADQIWMDFPAARFFRNSPVMESLDFLERLAPFSTPVLILRDDKPLFRNPEKAKS
ncbi:MAG: nitrous oxidase accessory protein [Pseudomonadota bacterium]|nr:nitrous oxidase accessory protein [Pseudomonadota bacterium]MDQ5946133.1 nitrous oxidase accessory protein [Pseudomonadota bacterium]MDQ5959501.1 nitrous oxidase accessory protein [Pseudomonadota bacterium]